MDNDLIDMQETVTPGSPANEQNATVSTEEREWSALKGSTQDRVRQVISERNEYKTKFIDVEKRLKELETKPATTVPPPPPTDGQLTPDQQKAIETLRKYGIVTKEDLQAARDQQIIEETYGKLEERYSGGDEKPAFKRDVIEKHMKETGIYNPEKAYEDLYREELFNIKMKERTGSSQAYTAKPSAGTGRGGQPLTMESLRERIAKPDGKEWWEKNRTKILPLMGELSK